MLKESDYVKTVDTVPAAHADAVRQAAQDAGASRQGNYDHVSLSHRVTGRFRPLTGATPAIGEVGKPEKVEEERIETLCEKGKVKEVVAAVRAAHPYEEPAIDILPRLELKE